MTEPRTLPHDPYIAAVCDALTAVGHTPADAFTDDSDTRGTHNYLRAVITLDDSSNVPASRWPHGLILIWEWHTGIEADQGEPDRGPVWQFAELNEDGSNWNPTVLPVYGYASPAAVAEAARKVIAREIRPTSFDGGLSTWDAGVIGDSWERHGELDAACEAWGAEEAGQ